MNTALYGLMEIYEVLLLLAYCSLIICGFRTQQEASSLYSLKKKSLTIGAIPYVTVRRRRQIWGLILVALCSVLFLYRLCSSLYLGIARPDDLVCMALLLAASLFGFRVLANHSSVSTLSSILAHGVLLVATISCSL
jgi:hypothetical protein